MRRCLVACCGMLLLGSGCGRQNGVVGGEPLSDAGLPDSGLTVDAGDATISASFETDFGANGELWEEQTLLDGASVTFGVHDESASDSMLAELRFPGHSEYAAADSVGAAFATQIATFQTFHFGTFRTRVAFGSCSPNEETVSAVLGYFSDGSDFNQNSIVDDSEITFQLVCGAPSYAFLTVFTDYEIDNAGTEQFRKLSHIVDFSSGDIYDTPSNQDSGFSKTGNDPGLVRPELFVPGTFYELGFEWHSDSLRFFLVLDGAERTLWTLSDPSSIPQRPVHFLYNMWHPESHWFPATEAADFPAVDVVMRVDWFRYYAE